ncbi:MAG: murein biosynthesis integral membrane protein MurJ [Chloroflexi bacterium]|nr:murein biosynthesis integral membrane protein MurJ [Chloroflexota bacterium]
MAEAPLPVQDAPASRAGGLAIAAAIVAFGFLGSRLLGILRTVAIARAFGASPELDAYNVAFRVPDMIFQVLAGATLGSAFIPVFVRLYRRDGEARAWQLASTVLNLVTVSTAVLCLLAFAFAPLLVPLLAPGLGDDIGRNAELTDKAVFLTRLMLLSPLLFAMSGMVTGILNARRAFFLPALAPMLYNVAIIFGALVLSGPFGVNGLAFGVVAGAGLHLAVQLPGLARQRMRYVRSFNWRDPATREVGRLMGPRVLGLAAAQVNFLITIYFASKVGQGIISNLNYAWLLAQLPLAIFGMALSTAVFPMLADHIADEDMDALHNTVSRVLRVIMFLTIPAALGLALLRVAATTVLLQHGGFTAADTAVTSAALGFYALGIVPQAGIEIHSRGFYAMGDTRTPVLLAVAAVGLNFLLSAILWERFEHEGLAFAVSASAWLEWLLLWKAYTLRTGASALPDLQAIARIALSAAVMALVIAAGFARFDASGVAGNGVIAVAGATAGGLVYIAMANWLGVEELGEAVARLRAAVRRA